MLTIGAASCVINNELGSIIQGAGVNKTLRAVHDDLEANAIYISSDDKSILLVSCDLAGIETDVVEACRQSMSAACGVADRDILIAGTHIHSGPSLIRTSYIKPLDQVYIAKLRQWLTDLAVATVESARPGRIGWGQGTAQIGWNRRVCFADGSHQMHGNAHADNFTGMEGPDDPGHTAVFAADLDGKLITILHNNTAHPTSYYGTDVASADFPGAARKHLRDVLGSIPIVFFNGAFGDICNGDLETSACHSESRDQTVNRAGLMVAGETLRLLHETIYHDSIILGHVFEDVPLNIRLPSAECLEEASKVLARMDAGEKIGGMEAINAFGPTLLQQNFGDNPVDTAPIHAIRIGDVGFATTSCELFCQFGLDIKRRSPAPITAIFGITDGFNGYCPTMAGIIGGGYSGTPFNWARLEEAAGYKLVDVAAKLLYQLWR